MLFCDILFNSSTLRVAKDRLFAFDWERNKLHFMKSVFCPWLCLGPTKKEGIYGLKEKQRARRGKFVSIIFFTITADFGGHCPAMQRQKTLTNLRGPQWGTRLLHTHTHTYSTRMYVWFIQCFWIYWTRLKVQLFSPTEVSCHASSAVSWRCTFQRLYHTSCTVCVRACLRYVTYGVADIRTCCAREAFKRKTENVFGSQPEMIRYYLIRNSFFHSR